MGHITNQSQLIYWWLFHYFGYKTKTKLTSLNRIQAVDLYPCPSFFSCSSSKVTRKKARGVKNGHARKRSARQEWRCIYVFWREGTQIIHAAISFKLFRLPHSQRKNKFFLNIRLFVTFYGIYCQFHTMAPNRDLPATKIEYLLLPMALRYPHTAYLFSRPGTSVAPS